MFCFTLNSIFHSVVGHGRDTQLQLVENLNYKTRALLGKIR